MDKNDNGHQDMSVNMARSEKSSLPDTLEACTSQAGFEAGQQAMPRGTDEPSRSLTGVRRIICVLSIFSSVFLYALDNTIVATIQPAIIDSLGHLDKLPWVSVAYQVTSVASDLTWYVLRLLDDLARVREKSNELIPAVHQGQIIRQVRRKDHVSRRRAHLRGGFRYLRRGADSQR